MEANEKLAVLINTIKDLDRRLYCLENIIVGSNGAGVRVQLPLLQQRVEQIETKIKESEMARQWKIGLGISIALGVLTNMLMVIKILLA